jgi:hypothetical protein
MDNIRAAMIIDRNMSPLEEEVRQKAMRTVIRMCPDHAEILAALGLAVEQGPAVRLDDGRDPGTCKRGHARTPENTRGHGSKSRCRPCERQTHAEWVARKRAEAGPKPRKQRSKDRSTPGDIARSEAISAATTALGMSWRAYRDMYGSKVSTARSVVEAVAAADQAALEALRRDRKMQGRSVVGGWVDEVQQCSC